MSQDPRSSNSSNSCNSCNSDAPADGDFASYVERLSAAQASNSASAPTPPPARDPEDLTPAEAASTAGLTEKVRSVRLVFLLVFVGQVLLLLFFQKGSLALLFFTGIIWVMLGKAQSALFLAVPSAGGDSAKNPNLERLHQKLQHLARERANKATKPTKSKK